MRATAAMSVISQVGFDGVSSHTQRVLPGWIAALTASGSLMSTRVTLIPYSGAVSSSHRRRPQYITFGATTCAGRSSARKSAVAAAMPEPSSNVAAPPSSRFSTSSVMRTVGVSGRP